MRFIFKPAGMLLLVGTIVILAMLAFRNADTRATEAMSLPAQPVANTKPTVRKAKNGLAGEYFSNMYLDGKPAFVRTDSTLKMTWAQASPGHPLGKDQFSVRWSGELEPLINGEHTFHVIASDGARVWVGDKLIIDLWRPTEDQLLKDNSGSPTRTYHASGKVNLEAGKKVPIKVTYYEVKDDATLELRWAYPGQPEQYIPSNRLTPNPEVH